MSDRYRLHYRLVPADRTNAARLALLHPLAMDGTFWEPVLPYLSSHAEILLADLRGHGRSPRVSGPWSAEHHGDDIADVFAQIGWPSAVVAGASMGGCVALALADRHPRLVSGLGLIDTTAWYGEGALERFEQRAALARQGGMSALVDFQLDRWFSESFRQSGNPIIGRTLETFLANDVVCFGAACRMLGSFDGRALLAQIDCPAAVIVGESDYAAPLAMAQALSDGIRGATLTVLPSVRHFTPLEVPQDIASWLVSLISFTQVHE